MCGIIGAINGGTVINDLMAGLQRVEYRGYDSAGVAILQNDQILRRRAKGKLNQLEELLHSSPVDGAAGIAHTRWATHGAPTVQNAHPHATTNVAVVHNGIIENFNDLRKELTALGHVFESETDSEVIPHLITYYLLKGYSTAAAIHESIRRLEGAYAIGVLMKDDPEHLFAARKGSPLVVGSANHGAYLASDQIALSEKADLLHFLEDGDIACLGREEIEFSDVYGKTVKRESFKNDVNHAANEKGGFAHFMLKEIHEQPEKIEKTVNSNIAALLKNQINFEDMSRLTIVACGTSYYAANVAKYWFEKYANLSVETDIASEFRYREPFMPDDGAALFISQSGETADTLAALNYAKEHGQTILSIVNVDGSSIARESDHIFKTEAGTEIGVASTKAFTCQLIALVALVISAARARGELDAKSEQVLRTELTSLPGIINQSLAQQSEIDEVTIELSKASDALFLGRGAMYPLALEGALKLKEISYIHAEGYASGELKHGPIALVDEHMPVIVLAPKDDLFDKTVSNMQEVMARGGKVLLVTDPKGAETARDGVWKTIIMPPVHNMLAPILYAIPAQLIAYYTAVRKGTDVDQPRNLAKSVTVE